MEEEFRERNMDWIFKGYDWENLDDALNTIDDFRKGELYQHDETNCSTLCREKGKLNFPDICKYGHCPTSCCYVLSKLGLLFVPAFTCPKTEVM